SDFDRALGVKHGTCHHRISESRSGGVLSLPVHDSVDQLIGLLRREFVINRRNVFRLITSSRESFLFGVSSTFGILRKRRSPMMKRKAGNPILPLPICSCRSPREPQAVLESFRWIATRRSRPTTRSNSRSVFRTEASVPMSKPEAKKCGVWRQQKNPLGHAR